MRFENSLRDSHCDSSSASDGGINVRNVAVVSAKTCQCRKWAPESLPSDLAILDLFIIGATPPLLAFCTFCPFPLFFPCLELWELGCLSLAFVSGCFANATDPLIGVPGA